MMTLTVPSCISSHVSMYERVMREICLLMHLSNSSLSSSGVKILITHVLGKEKTLVMQSKC